MRPNRPLFLVAAIAGIILSPLVRAQTSKEFFFPVSYVSATTVYVNAGREDSLLVGDTLVIHRRNRIVCSVVTFAVSRHSSASRIVAGNGPVLLGDTASIIKQITRPPIARADTSSTVPQIVRPLSLPGEENRRLKQESDQNIVSGRIAVQYSGVSAEDSRFNLSQPSALTRIEVARLLGTSLRFSMYGRTYYDLSATYNQFGDNARLKVRMYEFAVYEEEPDALYGYSAGRITSRFVGGLGTFDGGQVYYRAGDWTSGVLYGAQVGERTMSIDGDDRRGALFLNYRYGKDFLHQYDGTIAYARELFEGKLDREFFYFQNLATIGTEWNIYQSAEVETQEINKGVRKTSPRLSNTFLSINYYPLSWFSANIGYDASTTVYLFETMKATPDTLIDRNYLLGYRLNATFRLSHSLSLSVNGTYRTKKDDPRDSRTLGGIVRMSAIAGSEYNAGVRYMNIRGVYNNGDNITVDLDRTFFYSLSVAARYDYYRYTLLTANQTYTTHTATANINYRITRTIYSALNFDRVWDPTLNSYRFYLEAGVRF
jgi:hypothetical protein